MQLPNTPDRVIGGLKPGAIVEIPEFDEHSNLRNYCIKNVYGNAALSTTNKSIACVRPFFIVKSQLRLKVCIKYARNLKGLCYPVYTVETCK